MSKFDVGDLVGYLVTHFGEDTMRGFVLTLPEKAQGNVISDPVMGRLWSDPQPEPECRALTADHLFEALKHGDEDHWAWLRGVIECALEGREVSPPEPPHPRRSGVSLDDLAGVVAEHSKFPANISRDARHRFFALELCGEAGEHANFMKKIWRGDFDGDPSAAREAYDGAARELVDAQVIVLMQAHLMGIDVLERALRCMLEFESTEKWKKMRAAPPVVRKDDPFDWMLSGRDR